MKNAKLLKFLFFLFITCFVCVQTAQLWRPEYFSNPMVHYFSDQFAIFGFLFPWISGTRFRYFLHAVWSSQPDLSPLRTADPLFISKTFLCACFIGVVGFIILQSSLPSRENPLLFLMTGILGIMMILLWSNMRVLISLTFVSLCTLGANLFDVCVLEPLALSFFTFLFWMLVGFLFAHRLLETKREWPLMSLLSKKDLPKYHPIEALSSGAVPIFLIQFSIFRELALNLDLSQRPAWICIALLCTQFYTSYTLGMGFIFIQEGRFHRLSKAFLSRLNRILEKQI
jgi:hypothetical protein